MILIDGVQISQSKEAWLKEGLAVLAESGHKALTIGRLATRLGVTKGSFYHHFSDRTQYSIDLLSYWEAVYTLTLIEISERARSAPEKQRKLAELVFNQTFDHERAIRAWAMVDKDVYAVQARIDTMRYDYLHSLFVNIFGSKKVATARARAAICMFVGAQNVALPLSKKQLREMYLGALKK